MCLCACMCVVEERAHHSFFSFFCLLSLPTPFLVRALFAFVRAVRSFQHRSVVVGDEGKSQISHGRELLSVFDFVDVHRRHNIFRKLFTVWSILCYTNQHFHDYSAATVLLVQHGGESQHKIQWNNINILVLIQYKLLWIYSAFKILHMVNTEASSAKYIRSYKIRRTCYADFLTIILFFP